MLAGADDDGVLGPDGARSQQVGQRLFHQPLDRAPDMPGAELGLVALARNLFHGGGFVLQRYPIGFAGAQACRQPGQFQAADAQQFLPAERLVGDSGCEPVAELR